MSGHVGVGMGVAARICAGVRVRMRVRVYVGVGVGVGACVCVSVWVCVGVGVGVGVLNEWFSSGRCRPRRYKHGREFCMSCVSSSGFTRITCMFGARKAFVLK